MTLLAGAISTYGERRERARELGARVDFAQEPLRLYLALVDAQEWVFERALATRPAADELAAFVVRDALPLVMEAAVAAGPERLREAVLLRFARPRGATGSRLDPRRRCDRRPALPALRRPAAGRDVR